MTVILSVLLGIFGIQFYENYTYSSSLNSFLEDAAVVSNLHKQASEDFSSILDFEYFLHDIQHNINKMWSFWKSGRRAYPLCQTVFC